MLSYRCRIRSTKIGTLRCTSTVGGNKTCSALNNHSALMRGIDAIIFDCDGVLWKGNTVIAGACETLSRLRGLGKKLFFVTNNSTKSREGNLRKFKSLEIDAHIEEIFSSSFAAAAYLEQNPLPQGKKAYIVGQDGIGEELDLLGIPYMGGTVDADKKVDSSPTGKVLHDPDVGAVIVGLDTNINYYKIQYAQLCLSLNEGCLFIATNTDAVMHLTDQQEWAGNGAMVGAIRGCTGREPIVVGKPSPLMIDYIVNKYGLDRARICMVGDRLDTDILFGLNNGLQTILTLSGVTAKNSLFATDNKIVPDHFVNTIADLFSGSN